MILDSMLNLIVEGIATVTARILNHPSVQDAVARSIEAGFQKICASPDLHDHVDAAYMTLHKHGAQDAEDLGKDLSRNIGHFWKGVFAGDHQDKEHSAAATTAEPTTPMDSELSPPAIDEKIE